MSYKIHKNQNRKILHWSNNKMMKYFEYRVALMTKLTSIKPKGGSDYLRWWTGNGYITLDKDYSHAVWYRISATSTYFQDIPQLLDKEFNEEIEIQLSEFMYDYYLKHHNEWDTFQALNLKDNSEWVEGDYYQDRKIRNYDWKKPKVKPFQLVINDSPMIEIMTFLFYGVEPNYLEGINDNSENIQSNEKVLDKLDLDSILGDIPAVGYSTTCRNSQIVSSPPIKALENLGWFNDKWCMIGENTTKQVKPQEWENWAQINENLLSKYSLVSTFNLPLNLFKHPSMGFKQEHVAKFNRRMDMITKNDINYRLITYYNKFNYPTTEVIIEFNSIIKEGVDVVKKTDYAAWLPTNSNIKYKNYGLTGAKVSFYKELESTKPILIVEGVFDGMVKMKDFNLVFLQGLITTQKLEILIEYFGLEYENRIYFLPDNDESGMNNIKLVLDSGLPIKINYKLLDTIASKGVKDIYDLWELHEKEKQ